MSKTSASVSSEVPNIKKQMKARRRRRGAFIVSKCSELPMKHKARVFDMTSQPLFFFFFNYEYNEMIFCFSRQVIVTCKEMNIQYLGEYER